MKRSEFLAKGIALVAAAVAAGGAAKPEAPGPGTLTLDDLRDLIYGPKHATIRYSKRPGRTGLNLERFGGEIVEEPLEYDEGVRFRLRSERHSYAIVAIPDRPDRRGYLGGYGGGHDPMSGGRDLADGPFTRETWNEILADIVAYELVMP